MKTEKTSLSRIPWTDDAVAGTGCTFRLRLVSLQMRTSKSKKKLPPTDDEILTAMFEGKGPIFWYGQHAIDSLLKRKFESKGAAAGCGAQFRGGSVSVRSRMGNQRSGV